MSKTLLAVLGFFGLGALAIIVLVAMCVSFHNGDAVLRNQVTTKQVDNKNEMDAMWKTISQVAQVADKDRATLMELFNGYAQGRSGTGDSQAIFKWIKEAVPNVDNKTFLNLQNIIVAQRDGFKFRQKELLDYNRERNTRLDQFPGSLLAMVCPGDHKKIDVVIVTSTRTEDAFKTGKDDDTELFKSNK